MADRARDHRRQASRLVESQILRMSAEVGLGRRFNAEHPRAPLDDVQIDLQYPVFVQFLFHEERDYQLLHLADRVFGRREEEVLCELLRYRARPPGRPPFMDVLFQRFPDLKPVDPPVREERPVLCNDDRVHEPLRDAREGNPRLRDPERFSRSFCLGPALAHECGFARVLRLQTRDGKPGDAGELRKQERENNEEGRVGLVLPHPPGEPPGERDPPLRTGSRVGGP